MYVLQYNYNPHLFVFQGGFPDSPARGDSVTSREGSLSDTEGESPRASITTQGDKTANIPIQIERKTPSPPCASSRGNGKVC